MPSAQRCNICGAAEWKDFAGRPNAACAACGSLERARLVALTLDTLGLPKPNSRILHVAPERGLAALFRKATANYRAVDFAPQSYPELKVEPFDMCKDVLTLETESLDLIVHNHVLEHILCDVTSVILHLHRALKPEGYHIFSIPIFHGRYDEYLGRLDPKKAAERFGQHDHCRYYGREDVPAKLGMVFRVDLEEHILARKFTESQLRSVNVQKTFWRNLNGNTIFALRKGDVYFSATNAD